MLIFKKRDETDTYIVCLQRKVVERARSKNILLPSSRTCKQKMTIVRWAYPNTFKNWLKRHDMISKWIPYNVVKMECLPFSLSSSSFVFGCEWFFSMLRSDTVNCCALIFLAKFFFTIVYVSFRRLLSCRNYGRVSPQ